MNIKGLYNKFRVFGKALSYVLIIFLLTIGAFLLYYFVSVKIYEKKGPGYEPFLSLYTIISPSMEPNIKVYDVIIERKTTMDELKVGDVITFTSDSIQSQGLTVTHRIVEIINTSKGKAFITKGDNNYEVDSGMVYESQLMGKVLFKIPQLGRLQFLIASKGGWFIVVLLPALGVIIYDIIKVCKLLYLKDRLKQEEEEIKKEQQKQDQLLKEQRLLEEKRKREKLAQLQQENDLERRLDEIRNKYTR